MGFLYKLLKAFNAAQTPWQITLAIVMGMMMGLTPIAGLQTAVLFIIALVVNIHFGLFLAIAGVVAPIAYLADGLFDALGFFLLSNPDWEPFWTMLYNNGWARQTAFDNTIVLGSTLVALVLALPLYFILNRLITAYRGNIAAFCQKNRFLSKLGIFTVEAKKPKLFRLWGLGAALFLVGGTVAFVILFLDDLLKMGLEKGLSKALNKPVLIERVTVDFTQTKLLIENVSIINKEVQSVVLGLIEADVDFNALLLDKTHIERLALEGIAFNVPITTAMRDTLKEPVSTPAVSSAPTTPTTPSIQPDVETKPSPSIQMPDVKALLHSSDLTVNRRYEEAQTGIESITKRWDQAINDTFGDQANAEITNDFNRIKKEANTKDLKKLATLKGDVDVLSKKIKTREVAVSSMKKEYQVHEKEIAKLIENVKKAKDEDYKALKSKYTFNEKGAMNVVGDLFGANIQGYVETGYEYYQKIAPYLSSDEETAPVQRYTGRNVKFKESLPAPTFWIAYTGLNGTVRGQTFSGAVHDITNDQKGLGKMTTWKVRSDGAKMEQLVIDGVDNRMEKIAVDTIDFSVLRIPSSKLDLALIKVHESDMSLNGRMVITDNEKLQGDARINYFNVNMGTKNLSGRMADTLEKELKQTQSFYIDIVGKGTLKRPDLAFKTNLETIVSKALDAMIQAEVARFEKALNAELDKMLQGKLKALTGKDFEVKDIEKLAQKDSKELKAIESEAKKLLENKSNIKQIESEAKKLLENKSNIKQLEKHIAPSDKKKLQKLLKF